MLSTSDAETLNAARDVLASIRLLAQREAHDGTAADGYSWGIMYETADRAERAVFHLLNVASAYLGDPIARAAITAPRP